MRKLGVTVLHSWSRSSILSRPILRRLRGFRSWFSHSLNARIRFLSEHGSAREEHLSAKDRSPAAFALSSFDSVAAKCPCTRWAWKGVEFLRLRRAIRFALGLATLRMT